MKTLIAALALSAIAAPAFAQTASVTVVVEDVRPGGTVEIALYDSAEAWNGDSPVAGRRAVPADGRVEVVFEDVEPGDYAIRLYHDENGDGDFNMNFMGIPTEGYGFSNNPFPRFRGAHFEESVFTVEAGVDRTETIELDGGGYW